MASEKPRQTVADYLVLAVSPALIMALVGSLVFFLVEVLYVGAYPDRLLWILFFFVFAIVLIARISLEEPASGKAILYGLGLGIPTFIGLQMFVEYPEGSGLTPFSWAVNLFLMALVWWCAHRL